MTRPAVAIAPARPGSRPSPVPVDEHGLDVDGARRHRRRRRRASPRRTSRRPASCSPPSAGTRWSTGPRDRRASIIEDDYDAEFRYDRDPVGAAAGPRAGPGGRARHGEQVARARRCGSAGSSAPPRLLEPIAARSELDRPRLARARPARARRADASPAATTATCAGCARVYAATPRGAGRRARAPRARRRLTRPRRRASTPSRTCPRRVDEDAVVAAGRASARSACTA